MSTWIGRGAVVAEVFAALEPPGEVSVDEAMARMETVARHAEKVRCS